MSVALAAACYLRAGWVPVWIPPRSKNPNRLDWQNERPTRAELPKLFTGDRNVGVLLGEPSGSLVDCDLDCTESVALAPLVLPSTLRFGRASRPRSHWLYRASGARYLKRAEPVRPGLPQDKCGPTLLELRSSSGQQTVMPPSVHPSGEAIEWDADDGRDAVELPDAAQLVDAADLTLRMNHLAAAVLVARFSSLDEGASVLAGGAFPKLPGYVLDTIKQWLGVEQAQPERKPEAVRAGASWIDDVVRVGPLRIARALGLEVKKRVGPNGMKLELTECPACFAKRRSDHDARPPVGFVTAENRTELFVHGKCGTTGDAIALASCVILKKLRPKGADEWRKLHTELVAKGVLS